MLHLDPTVSSENFVAQQLRSSLSLSSQQQNLSGTFDEGGATGSVFQQELYRSVCRADEEDHFDPFFFIIVNIHHQLTHRRQ